MIYNTDLQDSNTKLQVILNTINELPEQEEPEAQHVIYETNRKVCVGSNVLGTPTLGTGWTANNGTYTHASGNTSDLSFATTAEVGELYVLEFDTTYISNEFVSVGFGDAYRILTYTAQSHLQVVLKCVGNSTLYFTPASTVSGSISNITVRKIQETGTEVNLDIRSIVSTQGDAAHDNNFGFWNTLLGFNTAPNAINSTRTIALGNNVLRDLEGGHRNVGIGTFAMSQMKSGERNVSIGADAMLAVKKSNDSVAIGSGAGYNGKYREKDIAIGDHALWGYNHTDAETKQNIGIGYNAGFKNGGNNNVFIGAQAGYRNETGSGNVMIGNNCFGSNGGNSNTFIGESIASSVPLTNSIGLGKAAIPTKSNQMMLGSPTVTEVVMCGNKKIEFNTDGTVTWEDETGTQNIDKSKNSIQLKDQSTGDIYELCVMNGKLTLKGGNE